MVLKLALLILGWMGTRFDQEMPPTPDKVVTTDGTTLSDKGEITAGQNVCQTMGGMEVGSVWGHGSDTKPDETADHLHREAVFVAGLETGHAFKQTTEKGENP